MSVFLLILLCLPTTKLQEAVHTTHTTSYVVFPEDCNANPPAAFGGKLFSSMDRCAGITVRRFLYNSPNDKAKSNAVTLCVNNLTYHAGAQVKDLLFVTGTVTKVGTATVTMQVIIEKETSDNKREKLVSGEFVFCTIDPETKRSTPHGLILPVTK